MANNQLRRSASQTIEEMAAQMIEAKPPRHWKAPSPDRLSISPAEAVMDNLRQADKVDFHDLTAVKAATMRYLEACRMAARVPTIAGLAASMGVSRTAWYRHAGRDNEVGNYLQRIQTAVADGLIQGGMSGSYHPILSIFLLRNSGQGYVNEDQIVLKPERPDPLASDDPEELRRYLRELPDITSEEVEE